MAAIHIDDQNAPQPEANDESASMDALKKFLQLHTLLNDILDIHDETACTYTEERELIYMFLPYIVGHNVGTLTLCELKRELFPDGVPEHLESHTLPHYTCSYSVAVAKICALLLVAGTGTTDELILLCGKFSMRSQITTKISVMVTLLSLDKYVVQHGYEYTRLRESRGVHMFVRVVTANNAQNTLWAMASNPVYMRDKNPSIIVSESGLSHEMHDVIMPLVTVHDRLWIRLEPHPEDAHLKEIIQFALAKVIKHAVV